MFMIKILIVEDDQSLLNLYQIVLNKQGYETFPARHGEEAWEIMEKEHVDLVITDIMMPVMDGYVTLLLSTAPLTSEQIEYATRIQDSCKQLSSLTSNILQLSKLENQQLTPQKTAFSPGAPLDSEKSESGY